LIFDEEMLAFQFDGMRTRSLVSCTELGFRWPPPERVRYHGVEFRRVHVSDIDAVAEYEPT
jgi:hypothetical protein